MQAGFKSARIMIVVLLLGVFQSLRADDGASPKLGTSPSTLIKTSSELPNTAFLAWKAVLKTAGYLTAMIGALLVVYAFVKRRPGLGNRGSAPRMRALETLRVGPRQTVQLLSFDSKLVLVGVTEQNVTILSASGLPTSEPQSASKENPASAEEAPPVKQRVGTMPHRVESSFAQALNGPA